MENFVAWQAEGLHSARRLVIGAANVLKLSGGGPNVEAAQKALELLKATKSQEEWFQTVGIFNDAIEKLNNELQYRFGMHLYVVADQYGHEPEDDSGAG